MGTRSKIAPRCDACRLHVQRCLCDEMPRFELQTRIALVMHCREQKKTTATGPLALSTLSNSELFVHGVVEQPLDLTPLFEQQRRVLVLFPREGATPLDKFDRTSDPRPITLVVPDGNWRQASRVPRRVKGLERAEAVTLPAGPPTQWGLRHEPKEGGLATFEAIARALAYLESQQVADELHSFFLRTVAVAKEIRRSGRIEVEPLRGD